MTWIAELREELRCREQERATKDALRLLRATVFREQGPIFFADLQAQVRNGVASLAQSNSEVKAVIVDPPNGNTFTLRNPELRPSVKVKAHLHTMGVVLEVEERQNSTDSFVATQNRRIDFGLDSNDRLSLCAECVLLNIDDVAKMILRPLLGLHL